MGSTLTAAYICDDWLHLAHVGDCRAYLVRGGKAACLTSDHTVVGDMVRSRLISAEKARTHAGRSILTKAIGLGLFIQPEIRRMRLRRDDTLILCCDGVWSVLQDEEIASLANRSASMQAIAQSLIDEAVDYQTDDNCSVVVARLRDFIPVSTADLPPERKNGHGWRGFLKKWLSRF
jgi:protein phosphatase